MPTSLSRGKLTKHLQTVLSPVLTVGIGEAPTAGGWDDDPNAPDSSYVPYVVINPLTTQEAEGSFGDSNSEWRVPYSFGVWGVSLEQTEQYADAVRQKVVDLARNVVVLGDFSWKIQQARVNSIGGIDRNDNTEPSEFTQTDVVSLYITREF